MIQVGDHLNCIVIENKDVKLVILGYFRDEFEEQADHQWGVSLNQKLKN